MNTLLVIALAIGLAQCQSSADSPIETAYREGKEYIYDYESQVLTGLPKGSKIYSGIKIKAKVRFQFTTPSRVKCQFDDVLIYKVNDQIDTVNPTREMVPTEMFHKLMGPDVEWMRTEIFKPFSFSYFRGHIDDLVTEDDDPFWSIDIKRGVLSFFEVNFNERQSLQSLDNPVTVEHTDLMPKFYRVVEPSVTGECETSYWVKPASTPDGQPLMDIMKVRNYDRCLNRVFFMWDMFNGKTCDYCEPNMPFDPLTAQSSVRYNIAGSPSQFVIINAVGESQYNFVPYRERHGRVTSFTNQTLNLVDARPVSTQIPDPTSPKRHDSGIRVDKPEVKKSTKPLSKKQTQQRELEMKEYYQMALKALMAFEKFTSEKVEEEVADILIELRRLLRMLDRPYLEKLLIEVNKDTYKHARKGLLDILPVLGTVDAVDIILERLMKDDPIINWPPSVFMTLALMPNLEVPVVTKIWEFIDKKVFKDPIYRRVAWLSLGSLGYKMMRMNETEEKDFQKKQKLFDELLQNSNIKEIRRDLRRKMQKLKEERLQKIEDYNRLRRNIVESVLKLLKSPKPENMMLAIKTVGNLGFFEFLPEIRNIIMNRKMSTLFRMQAIFCTRRMHRYIPNKVRRVLLPVYLDFMEEEDIRMSAYLSFMDTRPPRPDLEIITRSILEEPSYNVGALVWANLMQLSNRTTTCNCIQSLARNATLALRYAKRFNWGLQYSNYLFMSSYNREFQFGHSYEHAFLFSSKERMPRGFAMMYNAAFLGQSTNMMEFGMVGKGLDSYLDQLTEESGSTSLPDILTSLLKPRKPRSVKPSEQEMEDIKQKMKFEPRVTEPAEGHFYFKLFSQELIYIDIPLPVEKENPRQTSAKPKPRNYGSPVSSMLGSLFKLMNLMRTVVFPLRHETMLTEAGLPLWLRLDLVGAMRIDTDFRLEKNPGQLQRNMNMVLDIKPSGLFNMRCEMGVDLRYFWTGAVMRAGAYIDSPLKLSVNIDPDHSKMFIKWQEERAMKPVKFEVNPMTMFRYFPREVARYPVVPEIKEILVVDGVEMEPFNYEYGKDWFGRIVGMTGTWPVPRIEDVPFFPMNGKYLIYTEYRPTNPTGLEFQIQHVSESQDEITSGKKQPNSESSSWWPFGDWFSSSEQVLQSGQPVTSQGGVSEGSSEESVDPETDHINLEEQDISIDYLKKKFRQLTKVFPMASKCGFVARIAEPGANPVHEIILSTFYQMTRPGLEEMYTVELRRAPIPKIETKPWKLITDIRMTYPGFVVEPSDLFSEEYQRELHKQIRISVRDDGRHKDTLFNLDTLTLTQAIRQLQELTQPSSDYKTIKDLVNYLMERSEDPNLHSTKEIIQKQRQLYKEVHEFKKQPVDIKKRKQISTKCYELLDKSLTVVRKVKDTLESTRLGQQMPEDSAMIHSVLLSVQITTKKLDKIMRKVRIVLPQHEQISIAKRMESLKEEFRTVRLKQEQHSIRKQPQELAKSQIEIPPEQRFIYRLLLDSEKLLMALRQKVEQHQHDVETLRPDFDEVFQKSEQSKEELDHVLIAKGKTDKMLRVKAFEFILQQKLIAGDLQEILKLPRYLSADGKKPRQDLMDLHHNLKKISQELSRRLVQAVNIKIDMPMIMALPQTDRSIFMTLLAHTVKQIQIVDQLQLLKYRGYKHQPADMTLQKLSKSVETLQEIHESIKSFVEQIEQVKKPAMDPVLIKTLKVLSKQAVLIEELKATLKQSKILVTVVSEPAVLQYYSPSSKIVPPTPDELKKKVSDLEKESIKLLRKIDFVLSPVKDPLSPKTLTSVPDQQPKDGARSLLEKIHMVQAKQIHQQTVVDSTIMSLTEPHQDKSQLMLKHLSYVYQIITDMTQLQKEQEKVLELLKVKHSESPSDKKLQTTSLQLKDSLVRQKDQVEKLTEQVLKKYSQDRSYQPIVQKIQQLKDQISRLCQNHKNLEQKMIDEEKQYKQSLSYDVNSPRQPQQPRTVQPKVPGEIEGVVTMTYGNEGSRMNMLYVKIFGKKSVEQLLFEQKQVHVGEQDRLVQDYLQDKQQKNDRLTPSYLKLKNELNMFKYWHVLCAYDKKTVSVGIRSLFWKTHEYLKYIYYPKSTLMMPDDTNVENNFELVTEVRRDMRSMDMELRTPYETTKFRNLHVPNYCTIFLTPNTETYSSHLIKGLTKSKLPATCQISSLRIKTLDQHRYEVPPISMACKKVLSMDCSKDSKYVVISQPAKTDLSLKDITILTKNEKIEIVQETAGSKVKVDSKPVSLSSPVIVSHEDGTVVSVKKSDKKVIVSIPKLSLSVITDGKTTEVKVGQYYWSKVCGLCGNLDSNPSNDLEGPLKIRYPDGPSMSAAYLVPDETCDVKQIQQKMGIPEIRRTAKLTPPVQQTKVIEKRQGRVHNTCFSTVPVKRCPENTSPEGITSRLVPYHCLDSATPVAQKLINRSHTHVLEELRYKTVDVNEYEPEPKACIAK